MMGLAQWTRLALDRFGTNLKTLFVGDRDNFLVEEDPVGEFLSRKADGTLQFENEADRGEIEANDCQDVEANSEDNEVSELSVVNLQQSLDEQQAEEGEPVETYFDENEERVAQVEGEVAEATAIVNDDSQALEEESPDGGAVATIDGENSDDEAVITTSDDYQMSGAGNENVEEAGQLRAGESQEDDEDDSLLDVFREEQFSDNPISVLSRGLGDMSVYSLLEETKRIADRVRKSSGEGG